MAAIVQETRYLAVYEISTTHRAELVFFLKNTQQY
jgi:hypothetical protein